MFRTYSSSLTLLSIILDFLFLLTLWLLSICFFRHPNLSHSTSPSRIAHRRLTLPMLVLSFYYSFMACIYTDFYHPCFFASCHLLQVAPEWLKNYFEKFQNAILINPVDALFRLFHARSIHCVSIYNVYRIVWYTYMARIYNYTYVHCTC